MKDPRDAAGFVKNAAIQTNDATDAKVLQKMRAAYGESTSVGTTGHVGRGILRFAAAAAVLMAAGILVGHMDWFAGGSVAWADVAQQFKIVPFFSVSIYTRENATSEPTQTDLWMSRDRHIRLRVGRHVVFAEPGQVRAYDIVSRQSVEPDGIAWFFLQKIGQTKEFSLEAIIEVMFGGRTTEVTPLINPDAVVSQDVVVFDVEPPATPERVRIWALRESRLPMRITVWDPREGKSTAAVFTYFRELPAEFFDPNAFEFSRQDPSADRQVNAASLPASHI
ncbi:MAG: hypothetical protein ABFE01_23780 [Phycisphaerales bacterium]